MHPGFQRHIDACNNAVLPGSRVRLAIEGKVVGFVSAQVAEGMRTYCDEAGGLLELRDPASLHAIARSFAAQGWFRFRGEAFDVRAAPGGPALATIDRGALPAFGIMAQGVHLNGLVQRTDGLHLWVARRAANKALDPGKFDHITAGGVSAGMDAWGTLLKESAEEADIPPSLAAHAVHTGTIAYAMERAEGLRRDTLQCYDLELPEAFVPRAADGEVESFELWPIRQAFDCVRDTDAFKFNVNLVLIDLFERLGMNP